MRWKIVGLLFLLLVVVLAAGIAVDAQEIVSPFDADLAETSPVSANGSLDQIPIWYQVSRPNAPVPAPNDSCEDALPISLTLASLPYSAWLDTTQATITNTDPIQTCSWGGPAVNSASVWWLVQVPEDGQLVFSTVSENPERYDTVVSIYPAGVGCGGVAPANEISCDDDTHAFQSTATAWVDAGATYLVEVTGWGSSNPGGDLDAFAYFDRETLWQSQTGVAIPSPLYRHVTVSDGQYLYLLGGINPGHSTTVYRYDPVTNLWSFELAEMPESYANTDGVFLDGRIYIPSGYTGQSIYGGIHYTYLISDNVWTSSAPLTSTGAIDEPFAWGAAAVAPDETAYFYTGGRFASDPDIPLPYAFKYNVAQDQWQIINSMDTARYGHRAAFIDDKLCVIGGVGTGDVLLNGGECYSFGTHDWSPMANMNIPRALFGSAVGPDGQWYVFGGLVGSSTTTPKTEVYNPKTGQWTLLNQQWSLGQSRDWIGGARVGSRIFAAGGYLPQPDVLVDSLEWLFIQGVGTELNYLPLVIRGDSQPQIEDHEPNDSISLAYGPLASGSTTAGDFPVSWDTEDFYFFNTLTASTIQIDLTGIPADLDYHLYLYGVGPTGNAKYLYAASENPSNANESIQVSNAPPGRYSVRIRNVWRRPSSQFYSLQITY